MRRGGWGSSWPYDGHREKKADYYSQVVTFGEEIGNICYFSFSVCVYLWESCCVKEVMTSNMRSDYLFLYAFADKGVSMCHVHRCGSIRETNTDVFVLQE